MRASLLLSGLLLSAAIGISGRGDAVAAGVHEPAPSAASPQAEYDAAESRLRATYQALEAQIAAKQAECPAEDAENKAADTSECANEEPCTLMSALCSAEDPPFKIAGWTEWGYHNHSDGVINTHPHHLDNHQSWLYAERVADGSEGWDWGFRADIVYGTDGPDTQAFGNPPGTFDYLNGWDHGIYGWAMPQLYVQAAVNNFSVVVGHFYSKQGYEAFMATDVFFYSHSLTWNFNEPFTHTGFIATYKFSNDATVYGGWTAGLDTGFEQLNGGSIVHAGAVLQATEQIKLSYATCAGNFGYRGDGYLHTVLADVAMSDKWNYVFQTDVTTSNSGADHQFAIVNYLFYTFSDMLKAGARAEWWKTGGESLYEATAGLNIKPHANLTFRPELRYQWTSNEATAAALGVPVNDLIFGINAVVTF